jgi:hypothetical protein
VRKLKRSKILAVLMFCIFAASTMMLSGCGSDAEASRNWTLVNPEGATEVASLQLNERSCLGQNNGCEGRKSAYYGLEGIQGIALFHRSPLLCKMVSS